jgi:cytidine deaminase
LAAVAVACIDAAADDESFPCGQCRQRLHEFGVREVIVAKPDGGAGTYALSELLPHGFRLQADS